MILTAPEPAQMLRVVARIVAAAILGGVIGFQRQHAGKAAGLRTHMLVSMGCAMFLLSAREAGMAIGDTSRIIQGVATGVGFLGAGSIVKHLRSDQIHGLTTAATIWLTAAVGLAIGNGQIWLPLVAVVTALLILSFVPRLERALGIGPPS